MNNKIKILIGCIIAYLTIGFFGLIEESRSIIKFLPSFGFLLFIAITVFTLQEIVNGRKDKTENESPKTKKK